MAGAHRTLRAANAARQLEWDKDARITLSYRLNELAGETGEACNIGKKLERERLGIRGSRATVTDLAEELADVVICADLVAMGEGIDLAQAVISKFNATSAKVGLATMLASEAHPSRADRQVAHRFRFAADILEGMSDGVDGDRLGALVRWALHGSVGPHEADALARMFEAPWLAAADEGEFDGDTLDEARKDIERITREADELAQ
jgi:NTP pyrophosphatase (non-canonical NTP hydrolase)